jgi:hypothetical protein
MTNENNEIIDSSIDTDTTENEEELEIDLDEEVEESAEDDVEALKKEVETLKAQKAHWKKKATLPKEAPKTEKNESKNSQLSLKDQIAIAKSDIDLDDIDEVLEFASYKKLSISDALKSNTLKTILKEKAELRQTSSATNTGTTRKSASTVSDENLVSNAQKGTMPEKDEDFGRLVNARLNRFKK